MDSFTVNVFCNFNNRNVEDVLRTVTKYENIDIVFRDMFDDAVGYCILISDSIDEASSFRVASTGGGRFYSAFLGDTRNVEIKADLVDGLWPSDENPKMTLVRFKKLLRGIRSDHMTWFYRNLHSTVMDSIPELSWSKDLKGLHHDVNRSFAEMVGKTKEECEGRDHCYIWNVSRKETDADHAYIDSEELVLRERRTIVLDETVKTDDGMIKLTTYKSPVFNEFGDLVGTVGVAVNITDLVNAMHENELLVESVPFPVIVTDPEWRTRMMNATMRRLLQFEGPCEKFDYLTWKKYFLLPKSEPIVNKELHFTNQLFSANDGRVDFDFQINEQDIIDVFGNLTGRIIIPRKLAPNGEMLGKPAETN